MGKRSDFERVPRDFYPTPEAAFLPLLPHLSDAVSYIEPCAGDGRLIGHMKKHGLEVDAAYDIDSDFGYPVADATADDYGDVDGKVFLTNPPWDRKLLHPIIDNLTNQAPAWLLFDADWMHTKQSIPFMTYCKTIVSVGRVKWIEDSKMTGKDNCAWYLFDKDYCGSTIFHGRTE